MLKAFYQCYRTYVISVCLCCFVFSAVAVVEVLFVIPRTYKATASFAYLGFEVGLTGGQSADAQAIALVFGNAPHQFYGSILGSRAVQSKIIRKFNLEERFETSDFDRTRRALNERTEIVTTEPLLKVSVSIEGSPRGLFATNPDTEAKQLAADIANEYVKLLMEYVNSDEGNIWEFQKTILRQRRDEARKRFEDNLDAMAEYSAGRGGEQPDAAITALTKSVAQLRQGLAGVESHIAAAETRLAAVQTHDTAAAGGMAAYTAAESGASEALSEAISRAEQRLAELKNSEGLTEEHPLVRSERAQIEELEEQRRRSDLTLRQAIAAELDSLGESRRSQMGYLSQLQSRLIELPGESAQYTLLGAEVEAARALYVKLEAQYEQASLRSIQQAGQFRVVDTARAPDIKSEPSGVKLLIVSLLLGCAVGFTLGAVYEHLALLAKATGARHTL